jgi:hypothetical protein
MKGEISPHAAKELVRYLAGGAREMCGAMHPDEILPEQRYVDDCKSILLAIIDGRVRVMKKPRKTR